MANKTSGPYHRHACNKCIYIASTHTHEGLGDWYICEDNLDDATILRRGTDEGCDYSSWPTFLLTDQYRMADDAQGRVGLLESHIIARYMLNLHQERSHAQPACA